MNVSESWKKGGLGKRAELRGLEFWINARGPIKDHVRTDRVDREGGVPEILKGKNKGKKNKLPERTKKRAIGISISIFSSALPSAFLSASHRAPLHR